jgi:hypothetical protein
MEIVEFYEKNGPSRSRSRSRNFRWAGAGAPQKWTSSSTLNTIVVAGSYIAIKQCKPLLYSRKLYLKGPCHEIFDLRFFFIKQLHLAVDQLVKAFLHMASYSQRYSTMKSNFLWSAVSMTPLTRVVDSELFDWVQIHTPKNLVPDPASI